jgi:GTP-binding protein HflX
VVELNRSGGIAAEAAILVGVILKSEPCHGEPLDELAGLAEAAGARVVARLTQRREAPDPATYMGRGKLDELKSLVHDADADVVILDNDLSPAQTRNLEKAFDRKVIDRTELILDIFANRARTHEAQLAVELAQLEYALPRLKRLWTHLSRQKKGIGVRGPGEKQLETDRRLVERKIVDLKAELHAVHRRREREVATRDGLMTVSLVGYTNAGKSTLLNCITGAGVLEQDALFSTLDTRTRRWHLPGWGPILLSDTVGFIRGLPHHLIASFKATLEEARQANLLLHVADAGNPAVFDQISAAYAVLQEIGIEAKSTILVVNKVDKDSSRERLDRLINRYPNAVSISARTGAGLANLAAAVSDALSCSFADVDVEINIENGRLLAYLAAHGEVLSKHYNDSKVVVHCRIPQKHLGRITGEQLTIRPHRNGLVLPDLEVPQEKTT